MDVRQLRTLLAVAAHGSFSAAARALPTVQSNVSTHIAHLEAELGATLVDRRSGTLTEAGEIAAARARRIDAELDALHADVTSLHAEVTGTVRLGTIGTTARWIVPALLQRIGERHPGVRSVIVDATSTSLLPQLTAGRLDLAVVNVPVDDDEVHTEALFAEDTVLLAPAWHPLSERPALTLAELDGVPLLLEPVGTAFRRILDEQAAHAGISLQPQAEVDGMRLLASLAFQGFGATLVPASAAPAWIPGTWRRIQVTDLRGRMVALARRRRGLLSAPARALRSVLHDAVREEGPRQPGVHVHAAGHPTAG